MKKLIICLLTVPLIFLYFSCEKKENKEAKTPDAPALKAEQAKMEIGKLNDSINKVWSFMMQSDDQKMSDIKRLLLEISYTDKPSIKGLNKMQKMLEQIASKRYDQLTMADTKKIDEYDIATDSLIKGTIALSASTPGLEAHPLAKELSDDIMEADNNVVRYRTLYDTWAKIYNSYLVKNGKQLKELGEPYASFQQKPLFQRQP
jgi:hypothetical protein